MCSVRQWGGGRQDAVSVPKVEDTRFQLFLASARAPTSCVEVTHHVPLHGGPMRPAEAVASPHSGVSWKSTSDTASAPGLDATESSQAHAEGLSHLLHGPYQTDPGVARVIAQSGWPQEIFDDPKKKPRLVSTREEFLEELLLGNHLNDVVVFPGGLRAFGLEDSVPAYLTDAVRKSATVREFLQNVADDKLSELKARLYYTEREDGEEWRFSSEAQLKTSPDGTELVSLKEKATELWKRPDIPDRHMYLAELRKVEKYRHPISNDWVKTAVDCDLRDVVPESHRSLMPYWDVWDEGVFIGGALSGSPLHVDQVSWSNIGKNYVGYKLMAVWEYGPPSFAMLDENLRIMFVNRDHEEQMDVLRSACKIVVARPGDLILFSGANPHTAMCMGDGLSMTAYESFVNLNPAHAEIFVGTRGPDHFDECWADATDVEDIFDDSIDALEDALGYTDRTDVGLRLSHALQDCIDTLVVDPQFARWHSRRTKRRRKSASNTLSSD